MNFITPVTLRSNGSNVQSFEQIGLNENNQVTALLLPLVVRPSEGLEGSEWNSLTKERNTNNDAPLDVSLSKQLIEENQKLREEIELLKQKVAFYEQILPKLIPKVNIRKVLIEQLEALIDLWKNVEYARVEDDDIECVGESANKSYANSTDAPSSSIPNAKGENDLVELIPLCDICIPRQFLIQTREMANESATYYMRRILAYYFDQETFSKSSARGKGATKPLDNNITKAVWEHTLNQFPNCTMTTLVEDTNRRCAEARRTLNRKTEGRKHSSNRLAPLSQESLPFYPSYNSITQSEDTTN